MIYEIIGWAGTVLILLAYFLLETRKLTSASKSYNILNLFGAVGIMVNAVVHHALPSVGLNIIWLLIAFYGLSKGKRKRN